MEFEPVIGLEIHAQLHTNTKIFCGCNASFGGAPNSHGCPVCLGLPGSLPVLNRRVVEMAILAGCALNCTIEKKSIFARKNYFYPDSPKGYQISQYDKPVCGRGYLDIICNNVRSVIGITRIHLEEDAGKLIHDQDINSLFDVNRCGTPLIEIVTEPDIRSAQEAYAFLITLKQILEYLDICDCNMEEGSLRCDANISIRPAGATKLGTKTELKNMNSFHGVEKALEYEIKRQKEVVETGGIIIQQTYMWDANKNITVAMRSKEDAHDYRYFPEPDLMPLLLTQPWIDEIRATMPELPKLRLDRFVKQYALSLEHAQVLTDSRDIADYYEEAVSYCTDTKLVAHWVMGEILRLSKEKKRKVSQLNNSPKRLGMLLKFISDGTISASAAKRVCEFVEKEDIEPQDCIDTMGLRQISDSSALEEVVKKVIAENPKEVTRLKEGDLKLMAFFVGQAMRATKGKGNPAEINGILSKILKDQSGPSRV